MEWCLSLFVFSCFLGVWISCIDFCTMCWFVLGISCAPPAGVLAGPFVHFGFPYLFIYLYSPFKKKKVEIDGINSLNDNHQRAISIILIVLTVYIKRSMDEVYNTYSSYINLTPEFLPIYVLVSHLIVVGILNFSKF